MIFVNRKYEIINLLKTLLFMTQVTYLKITNIYKFKLCYNSKEDQNNFEYPKREKYLNLYSFLNNIIISIPSC